jgi:hypothetical protein
MTGEATPVHRPGSVARPGEGDAAGERPARGGDLEYADEVTLGRALAGRREM